MEAPVHVLRWRVDNRHRETNRIWPIVCFLFASGGAVACGGAGIQGSAPDDRITTTIMVRPQNEVRALAPAAEERSQHGNPHATQPASTAVSLGDDWLFPLPVRPGEHIRNYSDVAPELEELPDGDGSEEWVLRSWRVLRGGGGSMSLLTVSFDPIAQGLVFLADREGGGFTVVATYSAVGYDGGAAYILLHDGWSPPDDRFEILLFHVARELTGTKGAQRGGHDRRPPIGDGGWVAIGADPRRVWIAAPADGGTDGPRAHGLHYTRMRIEAQGSTARLVGCQEGQRGGMVHHLDPTTLMFGPPVPTKRVCPVKANELNWSSWRRPYICND